MILNNCLAMRRIIELRRERITPNLVCEIQRIVTDGTLDNPAGAGVLQHDNLPRIGVWDEWGDLLHSPPPVEELPDRLARLCSFANEEDWQLLVRFTRGKQFAWSPVVDVHDKLST